MGTLGLSDILLLIAIIASIYFFIRLVRYSLKTKKRFVVFLFSFLTIILILTLPFHYFLDRNKVLLKANFTFSHTFITQDDIDKMTDNYNHASVSEKFAIMNEPFYRTLLDAGIIYDTKKKDNQDENVQGDKLSEENIWFYLYPLEKDFDQNRYLIRKVKREGADLIFQTEMSKIFYYNSNGKQKATVIILSYDSTQGHISTCHGCSPEMGIATFESNNNSWSGHFVTENWEEGKGQWGESCDIRMDTYNGIQCLVTSLDEFHSGKTTREINYYNIETLENIKSIETPLD